MITDDHHHEVAIRAKAEPTPPVPTTRIRTAQGFYTNDPGCSAHGDRDTLRAISANGGRA